MSALDKSFERAMKAAGRSSERQIRDTIKGDPEGAFVVVNRQAEQEGRPGLFYKGQGYERNPAVWTRDGKEAIRYNTDSAAKRVADAVAGEAVQATFHLSPEHRELGTEGPRGHGGGKWNYEQLLSSYGSWADKCLAAMDPRDAADKIRTEMADDVHFIALYKMANFVRTAQRKAASAMVFVIHAESPKGKSSKVWIRKTAWVR